MPTTSGTLVLKGHVVAPFTPSWPYYFTFRIDAASGAFLFHCWSGHAWQAADKTTRHGPGTALEDDLYVARGLARLHQRTRRAGIVTFLVNLNGTVQVPISTDDCHRSPRSSTLTYTDAPGSNFAKKWKRGSWWKGGAFCTFWTPQAHCKSPRARSLQSSITAGRIDALDNRAYQLAPHAAGCNGGIHPGKGRGQIWYTQLDAWEAQSRKRLYTRARRRVRAQDWSSPTTITPPSYPYTYSPSAPSNSPTPLFTRAALSNMSFLDRSGTGLDAGRAGRDGRLVLVSQRGLFRHFRHNCNPRQRAGVQRRWHRHPAWEWRDLTGFRPL